MGWLVSGAAAGDGSPVPRWMCNGRARWVLYITLHPCMRRSPPGCQAHRQECRRAAAPGCRTASPADKALEAEQRLGHLRHYTAGAPPCPHACPPGVHAGAVALWAGKAAPAAPATHRVNALSLDCTGGQAGWVHASATLYCRSIAAGTKSCDDGVSSWLFVHQGNASPSQQQCPARPTLHTSQINQLTTRHTDAARSAATVNPLTHSGPRNELVGVHIHAYVKDHYISLHYITLCVNTPHVELHLDRDGGCRARACGTSDSQSNCKHLPWK
jgi:hypothetical protein